MEKRGKEKHDAEYEADSPEIPRPSTRERSAAKEKGETDEEEKDKENGSD